MGSARGLDGDSDGPRRLGKYRLLEMVGKGAMGNVYAAFDENTGRKVAVKELVANLENDPDIRTRFFREAQAAARLRHPNVITVYDVGEHLGRPFIVMELLRGVTLDRYLQHKDAEDVERRVDLMIQLCDAMAAAHAADIIHRDLKPSNLFVQSDGLLKVLDFGVARLAASSVTKRGAQPGTLHFMAPEQAVGRAIDSRSDIFSAGSVFYFMLTGRKPFESDEWLRVVRMLELEDPVAISPREAPPALAAIVVRMHAKDVETRYQTFKSVAADLSRFQKQYQSETRRQIEKVAGTYRAVVARLESTRAAAERTGQTTVPASPVLERLCDSYPVLRGRGSDVFRSIPFSRNRIAVVQEELAQELGRLEQYEQTLRQLTDLVASGEQALTEARYTAAIRIFEQVLVTVPESASARDGLSRARAALAARDAEAQQVKLLIKDAQAAVRAEDWERVVATCDQILAIDRSVPLALALRESGRRTLESARLMEAANRVREAAAEQIRKARASFRRGRCQEALAELRAFLAAEPSAVEARQELEQLTAIADAQAREAATRADAVRRHLESARACLDAGAFDDAVHAARQALECDPADQGSAALLCVAIDQHAAAIIEDARRRQEGQRESAAALAIALARAALECEDLVRAKAAAENAVRLFSSREATELVNRVEAMPAPDDSDEDSGDAGIAAGLSAAEPAGSGRNAPA